MTDCPRFGKLFNGCKFEARYDVGAPEIVTRIKMQGCGPEYIDALKPKTYVHDICIRCGKTVKRP